jgi:phosphatidylserine/phosphatidylglycerophosphate/cardiolipin synthase-like enzyme
MPPLQQRILPSASSFASFVCIRRQKEGLSLARAVLASESLAWGQVFRYAPLYYVRRLPLVLLTVATSALAAAGVQVYQPFSRPIVPGGWEVYFSPRGGCADAIIRSIRGAKKSVLVQAYSFTNASIAQALVQAHRRGVRVEIILDKSQESERYSSADFTARAGIPTWIDRSHAIAHNKVMVIDGATVITGSFNFSKAAEESNAENLLVIREAPELVAKYTQNWNRHAAHSARYQGK